MKLIILISTAWLISSISAVDAKSCTVLEDLCNTTCKYQIYITDASLPVLPSFDLCPLNVSVMRFENMDIAVVEDSSFPAGLSLINIVTSTIRNISDGALSLTAPTLESIHLDNSQVPNFFNTMKDLPRLEEILLRDVAIAQWEFPENSTFASTIKRLNLQNNSITSWPVWVNELKTLEKLSIIQNKMNTVTENSLSNLKNVLIDLTVIAANISAIPRDWSNLTALQRLTMVENQLTQARDVPSQLIYLNLENNALTELNESTFPAMPAIFELELSSNPLTTISAHAFDNMPSLGYLSFRYTLLTRVPLAVASLTKLRGLDFQYDLQLVCTCEESPLADWFSRNPQLTIWGTCGDVTVKVFFTDLAKLCPAAP
ncbi:osteomodulin-like [Physella acuta]|uniref:osteomodulin-like n=1 Tax=Physella acuta TaxID=109671 RepID=UPI0027DCF228|nr:osteomodulin-like [Physella acuta]